jgi:cytochrome c peroxidase
MKKQVYFLLMSLLMVSSYSCQDDTSLNEEIENDNYAIISKYLNVPEVPYNYTPQPPEHAGSFQGNPGDKFLHPAQIKLRNYKARAGRALFYDTRLSHNNSVSCASCHHPDKAFADNFIVSKGFEGIEGRRNSLPLGNTVGFEFAYGSSESVSSAAFSWDDTVEDLQSQIKMALTHEVEMGMTMDEVVRRVREEELYQALFKEAGLHREINEEFVLETIEAFVNSIIAVDSKFDREMNKMNFPDPGLDFAGFTDQENRGKRLFNQNCSSCHGKSHTGVVVAASNNGLEKNYSDQGKGEITGIVEDMGVFKVPFLRNITLTGPYMHDGRFATLEEVIDHYSTGIQSHQNLGEQLKNNEGPLRFDFSESEKEDIIAYLHTLTDNSLAIIDKYQNPFK